MFAGASWGFAGSVAARRDVPTCANCNQDVDDVPASAAQHAVVYCSEWCALAGHRLRTGPKKPEHLNK